MPKISRGRLVETSVNVWKVHELVETERRHPLVRRNSHLAFVCHDDSNGRKNSYEAFHECWVLGYATSAVDLLSGLVECSWLGL